MDVSCSAVVTNSRKLLLSLGLKGHRKELVCIWSRGGELPAGGWTEAEELPGESRAQDLGLPAAGGTIKEMWFAKIYIYYTYYLSVCIQKLFCYI